MSTDKRYKPSWLDADVPEWANYLAQDRDGLWFWYSDKPVKDIANSFWLAFIGQTHGAGFRKPNENWQDTLEQRPEEKR